MSGWGNVSNEKSPFGIGKALMASMLVGLDKENTIGWLWANTAREVNIDKGPMTFIKETHTKGGGKNSIRFFNYFHRYARKFYRCVWW